MEKVNKEAWLTEFWLDENGKPKYGYCEHCGDPITAVIVRRQGRKFCSPACAKEATDLDFDLDLNNYLIDTKNGRVIVKRKR